MERAFSFIGTLYSYLYCMLAASVLISRPILGGALFLAGQAAAKTGSMLLPSRYALLSKPSRRVVMALPILLLTLLFLLFTANSVRLDSADFWRLAGIVLCILLRPAVGWYLAHRVAAGKKKPGNIPLRILLSQMMFLPPLLLFLLHSPLDRRIAWALAGGYAVSGILESFSLGRERERIRPFTQEDRQEIESLRGVHACQMYHFLALFTAAALQTALVLTYTYIALSADGLIPCMGIALLCTCLPSLAVGAALRKKAGRETDPNRFLLAGFTFWLVSMVIFICVMDKPGSVASYVFLAFCPVGITLCVQALISLKEDMRRAAAFAIGHAPGNGIDMIQQVSFDLSVLAGQMAALIGLTLICFFTAPDIPSRWDAAFRSFSPLLILPALALACAAILFALKFPLTRLHLSKLRRYMEYRQNGEENAALRDQLQAVVVQKSVKCYGIKAIIWFLWPLCYHRIRDKEKAQLDKDIPCVFVCNHGEIYGPIVAVLYVPFPFRPWVAYEMTDRKVVLDRTMNGAFQNVKRGRKLLERVMRKYGAPFLPWVMKSVNCIPVYHDNPRKLIQTFRETVTTMQAGDNILLFPENAETSADHRYVREGVSEFFTGFTMIGQMYYNKTGKCPLFVPLYANKRKRTITFGTPTRYDPDADANQEKERICNYLRGEMLRMSGM